MPVAIIWPVDDDIARAIAAALLSESARHNQRVLAAGIGVAQNARAGGCIQALGEWPLLRRDSPKLELLKI